MDFLWPAERLVVEVDGLAYHSSPAARRRDRRRDGDLVAAGYTVLRVTWVDLHDDRDPLLARLSGLLARLAGSRRGGG